MKNLNEKISYQKSKNMVLEDLKIYEDLITKKLEMEDFSSALSKVESAIILIKNNQEYIDFEQILYAYNELKNIIELSLKKKQMNYLRRYNNLLNERINESNLENFVKLLAVLKNEVNQNLDKYNLQEINVNINKYFEFIKRIYEILSCCDVLNYNEISGKIFDFINDIKTENFSNLKFFIANTYKNLIAKKLSEISKEYDKISISLLSKKMAIKQEHLVRFIYALKNHPKSPIIDYNSNSHEVQFK